ncbi:MAG: CdvA-like protein [Dehalococcoidia bacterium]|nr:CdvA-like protein [Dehalococcoidia bacterium]
MAKEIKRLIELFAVRDDVETFLANLENLKTDGSINYEQYSATSEEYYERLGEAISEIARIKNELKKQLASNQQDIETHKQELTNLEVKYKVGELPQDKYQSSERKLRAKIDQLESTAGELKRLVDARSPVDLGVSSAKKTVGKEIKLPKAKVPKAKAGAPPSPARVTPLEEGFLKPRTKIAALVGGVLLLVSLLLPWVAASKLLGEGFGTSSGMNVSIILSVAGITCGLIAIGSAFFPSPKARGAVQIVMAVLALAALLVTVLMGKLPLLSEYARTLIVMREGFYLYIIAAVMLITVGSLELRQS